MKSGKVKTRIEDRVAIITLASPPGNSVGMAVCEEIVELLKAYECDDEVRCVMLTHEGPDFSSEGAGPEEVPLLRNGMTIDETARMFRPSGRALIECLDNYSKPTLAAGKGFCYSAATVIFNACDIRIAGESLRFYNGDLYGGLASDWGVTATRLPIWIGRNKMLDYAFLDEEFTARQLYDMGMVSKVVPDALVQEVGLAIAKKMATSAPLAVKYFKECLRRAIYGDSLMEKVEKEIEAANIVYASEDAIESVKAFLKGETYSFKGR